MIQLIFLYFTSTLLQHRRSFSFQIDYHVTLRDDSITTEFEVRNTGKNVFKTKVLALCTLKYYINYTDESYVLK